ncbi:MAG: Xaa-Pro peptidase family protein [Spirochaetota bacterium]|nr:Xaa-Pro peptidase family protein [Spirochaetota bacterium]
MKNAIEKDIKSRIERFQESMSKQGIEVVFILQKADLFYFSGTVQSAVLCIPVEGHAILLVKKSYNRAREESPIDNIIPFSSYKELPALLKEYNITNFETIGMELDVIPASIFISFKKIFPKSIIKDISNPVRYTRMKKSSFEIENIRKAGRIADTILKETKFAIKAGQTEVQLASAILNIAYNAGSEGPALTREWNPGAFVLPLIMSGENAAMPSFSDAPLSGKGITNFVPIGPSNNKIKENESIIVDIGVTYNSYQVDVTRIFSIGKLPPSLIKGYEAALKIEKRVKNELIPGKICSDIYSIALEMAKDLGFEENFMGYGSDQAKFLGHGLGIEMNELPVLAKGFDIPLEEGMVIAIEPKFVFPGIGAIGIENTWLITKTGPELIITTNNDICIV